MNNDKALTTKAVAALRFMIASGELVIGKAYSERELTEKIERICDTRYSGPPISQALAELTHQGLIVPQQLTGMMVKGKPHGNAAKTLKLRESVERTVTLELALQLADDPESTDLTLLEEILTKQEEMLDGDEHEGRDTFLALGGDFHRLIAELAGFSADIDVLGSLWSRSTTAYSGRLARGEDTFRRDMREIVAEHRDILTALSEGEAATKDAVDYHFTKQRQRTGVEPRMSSVAAPASSGQPGNLVQE